MTAPVPTLRRVYAWHRPLTILTAACFALLVVCVVGLVVDPRVLTGAPIWEKPAKFAVSIAIYAFTLAWLISLMPRWRRLGSVLGTIIAVMLAGEIAAVLLQVARGRTSHFDYATPFDAAVYQAMAVMIGTLWLSNLVLVIWLLLQRLPDRSLTWALRLGMIIAVVGMALAFLMTLPTSAQQATIDAGGTATVVGAHTVGLADGGPGLPILGWSTVGGDLRIPHFVGLHGLQVMILLALALTALGRRHARVADSVTRVRLVFIAAAGYLGLMAVLTWQALRGQSIVHPDARTALALAAVAVAVLLAATVALQLRSRTAVEPRPSSPDRGDAPLSRR